MEKGYIMETVIEEFYRGSKFIGMRMISDSKGRKFGWEGRRDVTEPKAFITKSIKYKNVDVTGCWTILMKGV